VHRRHHHDKLTFAPVYAFNENFVLALSHDEVVHGKGTLLGRMPGDDWQRFANLRAYLGFMYGHPGKKLLFMGGELGQWAEWNHDHALDWPLLDYPAHRSVQDLVRDLNRLYRDRPELHAQDFDSAGFEWIDWENREQSVLSWLRFDRSGQFVVCVSNFTPVTRDEFRLGIPASGNYKVLMDTDREEYGGGGALGQREITASAQGCHGRPCSLQFRLPPLATLVLQPG